jgi:type VI secretion system protein ImpA
MKTFVDLTAIFAPIGEDEPAGADLRYSSTYDEIKEARRSDDLLDQGVWQREIKTSDWDAVVALAVEALSTKTKDLQIAAWLAEALLNTDGFEGFTVGLQIVNRFLLEYWEQVYPRIEDGDLDYRAAPVEFMNEKLWASVKQVPLTDPAVSPGYSWSKWQDSRDVGYEADTRDRHGNTDYNKSKARQEKIAEGKISAEDFDAAVALTSRAWYEAIVKELKLCTDEAKKLDSILDQRFGPQAPGMTLLLSAIEDCDRIVARILKEKRELEPDPQPLVEAMIEPESPGDQEMESLVELSLEQAAPVTFKSLEPGMRVVDTGTLGATTWEDVLTSLRTLGIKKTLEDLVNASCSAPSVRETNRYRLLMARLCLEVDRPDLARPIVEELNALIEELHLERWESPLWIAEVLDALYRCLTKGDPSSVDPGRVKLLFEKLCTIDVTKAMNYRS